MIDWIKIDKENPPKGNKLFWFDGTVYDGWPLINPERALNMRDEEGYPMWEQNGGPAFYGVRWYAEINGPKE